MKSLKNVLLINGLSSGATGLILVLVPSVVASLFGVNATAPFIGVGLFLIVFAALVLAAWKKDVLNPKMVGLITVLDTSWVLVSAAVVVTQAFALSPVGYALITVVAMWVALMAFLQYTGTRKLSL